VKKKIEKKKQEVRKKVAITIMSLQPVQTVDREQKKKKKILLLLRHFCQQQSIYHATTFFCST